jgi:N-hydroxyarylamine O-acetyltransferase
MMTPRVRSARDYLDRIGADFPKAPTLGVLRELHLAHLRAVPFENLDVHLGVPIVLEEERLLEKIVTKRRGGFCYELNYCFHWLLRALGFQVTLLSAEVARPEGGFGIPYDHMALLVEIDGPEGDRWLADVGFGDSFLRPLPLSPGWEQQEEEYLFRLRGPDPLWLLERASSSGGDSAPQYRFTTTARSLEEFRDACRYHQTSPQSTFTQKVVATRALDDGRVTVARDRLIVRQNGTRSETRLASPEAFREALARHVGLSLELS